MSIIARYSISISGIDTFITRIEVIMIKEFNLFSSDINSAPNNTHACVCSWRRNFVAIQFSNAVRRKCIPAG